MKSKLNIGTASIVLIFILLCLSVFSLLCLSDGTSSKAFAERYADSVTAYYQADRAGQSFIRDVWNALSSGKTPAKAGESAAAALPKDHRLDVSDHSIICEIPMNAGQALHIELDPNMSDVLAYYVYNKEDYAIDNRLPVWTGSD